MELRFRKAIYFIQKLHLWIAVEDILLIIKNIEKEPDFEGKMTSQEIIDLVCQICEDV